MRNKAELELLVPFKKLPTIDMSVEQGNTLVSLLVLGSKAEIAYNDMLKDEMAWKELAIHKRVDAVLKLKVEPAAKLFIAYLSANHGFSMPLCIYYYMKLWSRDNKVEAITLKMLCEQIFPHGFPSISDVNTLWDKTKVDGAPILDIPQYCESIFD